MKQTYILAHPVARQRALDAVKAASDGYCVTVAEPTRTLEQNAAQWPYLAGFAAQLKLCINGVMQVVTDEDWKDVLTACYGGEMRMAVFDNKVIMLPHKTSKMGKKVFSDWMEFLIAMAAQFEIDPIYKTARQAEHEVTT